MRKLRQPVDVPLSAVTHDIDEIKRTFNKYKCEALVKALKKNFFEAYYAESKEEAVTLLNNLIEDGSIIGVGDSHSFYQLNMEAELKARGCRLIPNVAALNLHGYYSNDYGYIKAPTREQARDILADYLTSDVFVLSANAVTMEGEIVNVDGVGNRIAGSLYGADRIIMVVGINKIVQNEAEARSRIANLAAPMNKIKYGEVCASVLSGKCAKCKSEQRFCNITTILHRRPIESDYHIIVVGEDLGF